MKFRRFANQANETLEMSVTPMVSICFLLIMFFMLSLRLYPSEGGIAMNTVKAASRDARDVSQLPTIRVRLEADAKGQLARISINQRRLKDFDQLRSEIRSIVRDFGGTGPAARAPEVELDTDYYLKYEYTVDAITAISGYRSDDGQSLVKLVEHVKFSPRRKP